MSALLIPAIIAAVVITMAVLGIVISSRRKTVPPGALGIFFGRKYPYTYIEEGAQKTGVRGFEILTGGGRFLWPVIEQYQTMNAGVFQVAINEQGVPTAKNVPVSIAAMATCQISKNPELQANAAQAFMGKDQQYMAQTVHEILRGHVRSIIAGLTIEQILRDREEFRTKAMQESADEFKRIGIEIVTLVVQDVNDDQGYIEALGKKETAATIRDAAIATAEAEKETKIKVSDAQRAAAEVDAQNKVKIAHAGKELAVQEAQFKTETETKRAVAETAFAIAKTQQDQNLKVLEAERDQKAAHANIAVQEAQAKLTRQRLEATKIVEAEMESRARIIAADAAQQVAGRTAKELEIRADGVRAAAIKEADGISARTRTVALADAEATRVRLTAEADGNKAVQLAEAEGNRAVQLANAEGSRATLMAAADGEKAKLTAVAEGSRLGLLAQAEGTQAKLLAEARGTRELAEALRQLDANGRFLMVLEKLPPLIREGGDAGAKLLGSVFTPIGESLGAIDSVRIIDMGGGDSKGSGVAKFAGSIPAMISEMLIKAEAQGIDIKPLAKLLKIDGSKLSEMIGLVDAVVEVPATPAPAVTEAKS